MAFAILGKVTASLCGCASRGLARVTGLDPKNAEHMTPDAGTRLSASGIYLEAREDSSIRFLAVCLNHILFNSSFYINEKSRIEMQCRTNFKMARL